MPGPGAYQTTSYMKTDTALDSYAKNNIDCQKENDLTNIIRWHLDQELTIAIKYILNYEGLPYSNCLSDVED